ncbi:MAG: cytidylate kinase-like family protein [Deltaproteobacteria bacterium]|nr:cytidylate kinase-like family protein [Deltaproteobacteria bacterium]
MSLITITTGIACGGMATARRVAEELGMVLYDDDRLQEEAIEMGFSSEDMKSFDQTAPGLLTRLLRGRPAEYLELMAAAVYEVARRGEGILCGNGAPYFLRDFGCALHLRIHASEEFRVARLMKQKKIGEEEARKLIEKADSDLKGFMQFSFQMDWNDISLYDAIINVDKIGLDSAAAQIIAMAGTQQIQACSLTALETMEKLSLLKRVEAAILKNNINPQELFFEVPETGVVKIMGLINPMRTVGGVLEIVRAVPGVKDIICEAERHPMANI